MLEVLILDAAEQLSTAQPAIKEVKPFQPVISYSDISLSPDIVFFKNSAIRRFTQVSANKVWLFDSGSGSNPSLRTFALDTQAMTLTTEDSTGRGFKFVAADSSGVIWAVATGAAYYGLWKRTATNTWTRMLTDTTSNGRLHYNPTNSKLYFISDTNNWYELANGTASLTTSPSIPTNWGNATNSPFDHDWGLSYMSWQVDSTGSRVYTGLSSPNFSGAVLLKALNGIADYNSVDTWVSGFEQAANIRRLTRAPQGDTEYAAVTVPLWIENHRLVPMAAPYLLSYSRTRFTVGGSNFMNYLWLRLINTTNWSSQVLGGFWWDGMWTIPTTFQDDPVVFAASLSGGTLRLILSAPLAYDGATTAGAIGYTDIVLQNIQV